VAYRTTVVRLREEAESNAVNALRGAAQALEARFSELDAMAAKITVDPRLTPFWIRNPGYSRIEAVRQMGIYASHSAFVDGIVLMLYDAPSVILPTGIVSREAFLDSVFRYEGRTRSGLLDLIRGARAPLLIPAEAVHAGVGMTDGGRFLTYVYPIPPRDPHPYGALLFLIGEERFSDEAGGMLSDAGAMVWTVGSDGAVLSWKGRGERIQPPVLPASIVGKGGWLFSASIENRLHSVACYRSENLGVVLLAATPRGRFLQGVVRARTVLLLALIPLAGLGLTAVYMLSRRSYDPVRRLLDVTAGAPSGPPEAGGRNEFDLIRKAFERETESRQRLLLEIEMHKPLVRDRFLARLIGGDIDDPAEIRRQGCEAGVEFPHPVFFVVVVRFPRRGGRTVWEKELALHVLRDFSTPDLKAQGLELAGERALALIMNTEAPPAALRPLQDRVVADILRLLDGSEDGGTGIGVGRGYDGAGSVSVSFLEAESALEQNLPAGGRRAIFFGDLCAVPGDRFWYPTEEELLLVQSLKQGNGRQAGEIIRRVAERIRRETKSVFAVRIVSFDLLNTVVKSVQDLGLEPSDPDLDAAARFTTVEELEENLVRLVGRVADRAQNARGDRNAARREEILRFVAENYCSRTFCLESLADRFELSLSHLSRFFKEQTGRTFTEHVNGLRMEEMKRRLRDTETPVKEIVEVVGYADAANCIRTFRRKEGVTPGRYRALYHGRDAPFPGRDASSPGRDAPSRPPA